MTIAVEYLGGPLDGERDALPAEAPPRVIPFGYIDVGELVVVRRDGDEQIPSTELGTYRWLEHVDGRERYVWRHR